jgi:hypothetical protein
VGLFHPLDTVVYPGVPGPAWTPRAGGSPAPDGASLAPHAGLKGGGRPPAARQGGGGEPCSALLWTALHCAAQNFLVRGCRQPGTLALSLVGSVQSGEVQHFILLRSATT